MSSVSFRQRLTQGELLLGSLVTLPLPQIIEIMVQAGFDWLFIDAEHAPLNGSEIQLLVQAAGLCPCLVRLPNHEPYTVQQVLDGGAAGIIVPQVNSAAEAERIVAAAKYPPQGDRSVGIGRAHGYGAHFHAYLDRANEETAVIVQVEHWQAVENIEQIVQVPGIDAVFVGPYDLSSSLGKPGQIADTAVQAQLKKVRHACLAANIPLGIFGMTAEAVSPYQAEGYTLLAVGLDTVLLSQAAQAVVTAVRTADANA